MKVLLTGGAGYIGTHTTVALIEAGHEVVVADNFVNSSPEAVRRVEAITGARVPVYRVDVCDKDALHALFDAEAPDAVIHFAGLKAVGESVEVPLRYYRNNLDSMLSLMETMAAHGVNKLVFSSSATVYGLAYDSPEMFEDYPTGCVSPYGWTKYMIEQIVRDAAHANPALCAVLLRYFNPVGAHESGLIGENPNGIPNNLMPRVLQNATGVLPVLGVYGDDYPTPDGTCVRDYIHVVDLARGHVKALEYLNGHPGAEAVNLGTGVGYSVKDILHAFEDATGVALTCEIVPRRPGDTPMCYANPDKAARLLHWRAEKTLKDMCRDAWRWQTQNPNGYPKPGEPG